MAHFRVIGLRQATEHVWGIERIDDKRTAGLMRDRFKAKHEAEAEALRLNLLEAQKRSAKKN